MTSLAWRRLVWADCQVQGMLEGFFHFAPTSLPRHHPPACQEVSFEESQKYKEGKFIVEKQQVMKVCARDSCSSGDIFCSAGNRCCTAC